MSTKIKETWLRRMSLGTAPSSFRVYLADRLSPISGAILSAIANIVVASLLLFSLNKYARNDELTLWFTALMLATAAGLFLSVMGRRRHLALALSPITLFEAIKGLLWIIPATYLFPSYPSGLQFFIALLLTGAALSCAIAWHMIPPAVYMGIGVSLPIGAIMQFLKPGEFSNLLCLVMMGGWLSAISLALFLRSHQISRLQLLHEKDLLAQSVEQKILELERLRILEEQSRKEAETANAAKSRFLAHSSHDLRQPLHAINLLLETVSDKELNAQSKEVMARVRHSLGGLTELFDSLLDVALLDMGQVDVNRSTFPAATLLDQVVAEFSEVARAQDVDLRCAPTTIILHTDLIILRRLVQNLVSNATQHANGRTVLVGLRRQKETASIEVYDNGRGISMAQQEKIFSEFERLTDSTASPTEKNSSGLGLGLAIARRLARILDVQLIVNSTVGSGSVFRILGLPQGTHTDQVSDLNPQIIPSMKTGQGRVAIIDDDAEVLQATSEVIQKWGFKTDNYTEYHAADFTEPDIVLCDYELSGAVNGIEIIKNIRRVCDNEIPAIIITGNTSEIVSVAAREAGLSILYKPVRPAQLRSALLAAASAIREGCEAD